jgi:hypothetical protein
MRLIYLKNPEVNRQQQEYIHNINQHVSNKKPLVIYFYKEGCPYCIQTSKEWNNIGQYVDNTLNNDLLAVQANSDLYHLLQNVGDQPRMYPTIRYVHKDNVIPFTKEGSERTADSIAKWISEMANRQNQVQDTDSYREKSISPYLTNDDIDVDEEVEENRTIVPDYVESTNSDSQYTSNKYPPYSNQFIARNFNPSIQPKLLSKGRSISKSRMRSRSRSRMSNKSRTRSKSRSRSRTRSKSRSRTRSKRYMSRKSSHPRFLTSRKNKSLGTTAMI